MGNRRDGIRVKNLDVMHSLMPHIKPKRGSSDVYINQKFDMTNLVAYFEKLRKEEKYKNITYFHLFCAAIGKLIYNRPLMNRFIINKKYYDRKDVVISFVAKRELTDEAEESMTSIKINPNDNLFTISERIVSNVSTLRSNHEHGVDKIMNYLGNLPKWIKSILMSVIKFADNHDLLPASLTKDLLYYSTVIVSNLGSLGCGAIYHNITDFGTNSIMMMIGQVKEEVVAVNGKAQVHKMCEFGINLDERIADGFYFVKSMQLFDYILQHPETLEDTVNTMITMPDKKKK